LVAAIASVPGEEWMEAATYAAWALGGRPLQFSPAPGWIPHAGTVGAEEFITGRTVGRERYLDLLRSRLVQVIDDGLREDFVVRAIADEVSMQFDRLTDTEASNASRARIGTAIARYVDDPALFRTDMAAQDPSVLDLNDDEVTHRLKSMLDRLKPVEHSERDPHLELKNHWEDARQRHLPTVFVDEWRNRST